MLATPVAAWRLGYPQLPLIEQVEAATLRWYIEQGFLVMVTSVRTERPDGLLSRTLWEGFGWLDTMPRHVLSLALPALGACALALLLIHIGRTADTNARRRFEEHLTLDRFGADVLAELRAALASDVSRMPAAAAVSPRA